MFSKAPVATLKQIGFTPRLGSDFDDMYNETPTFVEYSANFANMNDSRTCVIFNDVFIEVSGIGYWLKMKNY